MVVTHPQGQGHGQQEEREANGIHRRHIMCIQQSTQSRSPNHGGLNTHGAHRNGPWQQGRWNQLGCQGLLGRHLESPDPTQHYGDAINQYRACKMAPTGSNQQACNNSLKSHANCINSGLMPAIHPMPCRQGHQQGRDKLKQAHQAQAPSTVGQFVHMPCQSDH